MGNLYKENKIYINRLKSAMLSNIKAYNSTETYNRRTIRLDVADPYFNGTYHLDLSLCFEEDVKISEDNRYVYMCVSMKGAPTVVDEMVWGIIFSNGYNLDTDKSKYCDLQKDLVSFMSSNGIKSSSNWGFDVGDAGKAKILNSKIGTKVRDAVEDITFTFIRSDDYYKRMQDKSIFPSIIYDASNEEVSCVYQSSYKNYREKFSSKDVVKNAKTMSYITRQTAKAFLRTSTPRYFSVLPSGKALKPYRS